LFNTLVLLPHRTDNFPSVVSFAVQAQIQGTSGACAIPIHIQSLPFQTRTSITQSNTPTVGINACGLDGATDHGIAYSFTGTGKLLEVEYEWDSTDDGAFTLFKGDCSDAAMMTCETSRVPSPIVSGGPITWEAVAGVNYTLIVAGSFFYGTSSPFSLSIQVSRLRQREK
jgi:hypothetical protein